MAGQSHIEELCVELAMDDETSSMFTSCEPDYLLHPAEAWSPTTEPRCLSRRLPSSVMKAKHIRDQQVLGDHRSTAERL